MQMLHKPDTERRKVFTLKGLHLYLLKYVCFGFLFIQRIIFVVKNLVSRSGLMRPIQRLVLVSWWNTIHELYQLEILLDRVKFH